MNIRIILAWSLLLALPLSASAQKYKLKKMDAGRIEITSKYDERITADDHKLLAPYKASVDSIITPIVGHSAKYMVAQRPESLLSNFMADMLLYSAQKCGGAELAVINIGGLRSIMPEGEVSYGDIFEISPFENKLCIVELEGEDLTTLFKQIAGAGGEGIAGAKMSMTPSGKLLDVTVNGKPIDKDKIYRIATLDYLAEGNDKMYAFKEAEKVEHTDYTIRQLLIDYLNALAAQNKMADAQIEGRITVIEE